MKRCSARPGRLTLAAAFISAAMVCGCSEFIDPGANVRRPMSDHLRLSLADSLGDVMVVAHRGCWRQAPENSVLAVEACIRLGVHMVEIDVRPTSDGHLVAMHDETVDRTTNGLGRVAEMTLAEIAGLRLREGQGGPAAALTDQRVPTLEQLLATARGRILVNLDAKGDIRDESYRLAESMKVADQVLIKMSLSSPGEVNLHSMRFFGNTHFMPILRDGNGDLPQQVGSFEGIGAVAFEIIYREEAALEKACAAAAAQRARCWVNTMWDALSPGHSDAVAAENPDGHWGHLVNLGVNMLQTDRPEELVEYLESRKGHSR